MKYWAGGLSVDTNVQSLRSSYYLQMRWSPVMPKKKWHQDSVALNWMIHPVCSQGINSGHRRQNKSNTVLYYEIQWFFIVYFSSALIFLAFIKKYSAEIERFCVCKAIQFYLYRIKLKISQKPLLGHVQITLVARTWIPPRHCNWMIIAFFSNHTW